MTSIIAKAALASLIALGALTGSAATASAGGVDVVIDVRHPHVRYDRVYHDRGYPGRCNPYAAVEKARWHGLRRPAITHVGPYKVVVEGRRHYRWDRIVFANARGCPVLYR